MCGKLGHTKSNDACAVRVASKLPRTPRMYCSHWFQTSDQSKRVCTSSVGTMSDTELDVSSLGSGDEGVLVFETGGEEEELEEEGQWESAGEDGEEEQVEVPPQPAARRTPPFLVVPEDEDAHG